MATTGALAECCHWFTWTPRLSSDATDFPLMTNSAFDTAVDCDGWTKYYSLRIPALHSARDVIGIDWSGARYVTSLFDVVN